MIYKYDEAIVKDLEQSFNPDSVDNPVVKVISPEQIIGVAAQIQNDEIKLPIVALSRDPNTQVDSERMNFSRAHIGVSTVIDPKTNELYYEKAIPISLTYRLTVLTATQADLDEIMRELMFKYLSMYFLPIRLPYEGNRVIRFGIAINSDTEIEQSSGSSEYAESGQLYQAVLQLKTEGCVLVTYTPVHLKRTVFETEIADPSAKSNL